MAAFRIAKPGSRSATDWVTDVEEVLRSVADSSNAEPMRAYMKGIAPFLGVPAPRRESVMKQLGRPTDEDLVPACRALYALDEREFHYVACEALAGRIGALGVSVLEDVEWFLRTKSWWDTVDSLVKGVGSLAIVEPTSLTTLERWLVDGNFWVARAAILHQLGLKERTDEERLFRFCLDRANEKEFFLRKAIGWALRDYAWTNPSAVRSFVERHDAALSGLTKREALKNIAR